jgi:cupin fold WbuC family metalloprotein
MKEPLFADDLRQLSAQAATADRRRAHLNTHDSVQADVQRLFIATEPDTYIRPHRHRESHKWEFFVVLEGALDLLIFDDSGAISERVEMSPDNVRAVEVPPGTWHTYICREPGTIALEVKQGAYVPTPEEDFAPWAPPENAPGSTEYLASLRR